LFLTPIFQLFAYQSALSKDEEIVTEKLQNAPNRMYFFQKFGEGRKPIGMRARGEDKGGKW
jgi:hypothetical protein